jgi:hypothetical protein
VIFKHLLLVGSTSVFVIESLEKFIISQVLNLISIFENKEGK